MAPEGFAQSVSAGLSKNDIKIGEQVTLTLELLPPGQTLAGSDFALPDTFNHIEIIERKAITKTASNTLKQDFIITSFDSGRWEIPVFEIPAQSGTIKTTPLVLTVNPVNIDTLNEYHDIKDILEVEEQINWWLYGGIAAGALLLAFIIFKIIQWQRRKSKQAKPFKPIGNPLQNALAAMEALQQQWQQRQITPKALAIQLTEIFKGFLLAQGSNALPKTGEELILQSQQLMNTQDWVTLSQSIRLCDAMKFAKYDPGLDAGNEAIVHFKKGISNIDQKMNDDRDKTKYDIKV